MSKTPLYTARLEIYPASKVICYGPLTALSIPDQALDILKQAIEARFHGYRSLQNKPVESLNNEQIHAFEDLLMNSSASKIKTKIMVGADSQDTGYPLKYAFHKSSTGFTLAVKAHASVIGLSEKLAEIQVSELTAE